MKVLGFCCVVYVKKIAKNKGGRVKMMNNRGLETSDMCFWCFVCCLLFSVGLMLCLAAVLSTVNCFLSVLALLPVPIVFCFALLPFCSIAAPVAGVLLILCLLGLLVTMAFCISCASLCLIYAVCFKKKKHVFLGCV